MHLPVHGLPANRNNFFFVLNFFIAFSYFEHVITKKEHNMLLLFKRYQHAINVYKL